VLTVVIGIWKSHPYRSWFWLCQPLRSLSKYNVRRGDKVKRGDIIGYVGNTGRSAGPHLHYEIFKDDQRINPLNFYYGNLSSEEFDALVTQAQQENQSMD